MFIRHFVQIEEETREREGGAKNGLGRDRRREKKWEIMYSYLHGCKVTKSCGMLQVGRSETSIMGAPALQTWRGSGRRITSSTFLAWQREIWNPERFVSLIYEHCDHSGWLDFIWWSNLIRPHCCWCSLSLLWEHSGNFCILMGFFCFCFRLTM